ncbi:MAG: DUF1572 domain-containing protein [Armatimonadetes bacterium]|nr:DUF1572 domain-containing protein [Armatimonadota bacterium]
MTESEFLHHCFIASARSEFRKIRGMAEKALAQVGDDELYYRLNPSQNCIAVVMRHVAGNMRSRFTDFLTTDGEKPWRNRDQEFVEVRTSRDALVADWEDGWTRLFHTLSSLEPGDLVRTITVRGEPMPALEAFHRQMGHYGYHVAQIVLIAKHIRGEQWHTLTIPTGGTEGYHRSLGFTP